MKCKTMTLILITLLFVATLSAQCPRGTSFGDGCSSSPAGTPQYPSMLSSYAIRPPWNVAGVEYHVGVPAGKVLTDWRNISNPRLTVNSNGNIQCSSAGAVTLDSIDFSLGTGIQQLYDPNSSCTWTVTNSFFACGSGGGGNVAMVFVDNVTLKNNTFDSTNCRVGAAGLSSFITGGGSIIMQYNWLKHGNQHVLETGTGGPIDYRFNLIEDMVPGGSATGQHENFQQLTGTGNLRNDVVSFNTVYQRSGGNGEGWQFYCNSGPCTITGPVLSSNTVVVLAGTNMSNLVNAGDPAHLATVIGATNANNYFDLSGRPNAYYAGTVTAAKGWTSTCNINMTSGKLINPADNSESTLTGCTGVAPPPPPLSPLNLSAIVN